MLTYLTSYNGKLPQTDRISNAFQRINKKNPQPIKTRDYQQHGVKLFGTPGGS